MTAEPRRVLIATFGVSAPFGTALYTRDLALSLLRRGWVPVIYTGQIGPVAAELRRASRPWPGFRRCRRSSSVMTR